MEFDEVALFSSQLHSDVSLITDFPLLVLNRTDHPVSIDCQNLNPKGLMNTLMCIF